jgi:hypothetical protein
MPAFDQARPPETTFDVAYLLAEIEELKRIAEGRLGTLAYLLECAAIEARRQIQQQREEGTSRAGQA